MKTILCHFYNEEFLLPWWLNHHKKLFDHGIMINYASTDRSVDLIKEICPTWQIVDSVNKDFQADTVDNEVIKYEKTVDGWRICLNVTEFILGDFSSLLESHEQLHRFCPILAIIDRETQREFIDHNIPLYDQIRTGLDPSNSIREFRARHFCNFPVDTYTCGRHYEYGHANLLDDEKFIILKYSFAPMTEQLYERKLQIQHKIPKCDRDSGKGVQHTNYGNGLNKKNIMDSLVEYQKHIVDLSDIIEKFKRMSNI